MLEASEADLELDTGSGRWQVRGDPEAGLSWAQIASQAEGDGLVASVEFKGDRATFPFGAHVAVVEVDVETGKVRQMRHVTVDDAGPVLNPVLAEGQRHGGIAQGAAQALLEEVRYDADGNPLTSNAGRLRGDHRHRTAQLRAGRDGDADHAQPAGRQGHRRGRHYRRHPGRAERRDRCRGSSRRPAHRHAHHSRTVWTAIGDAQKARNR